MKHDMHVTYTTDDDGIHLWCLTCQTDIPLGFSVSPENVMEAATMHREGRD